MKHNGFDSCNVNTCRCFLISILVIIIAFMAWSFLDTKTSPLSSTICNCFRNKSILFVGDSIMKHMEMALLETTMGNKSFCDTSPYFDPRCAGDRKYQRVAYGQTCWLSVNYCDQNSYSICHREVDIAFMSAKDFLSGSHNIDDVDIVFAGTAFHDFSTPLQKYRNMVERMYGMAGKSDFFWVSAHKRAMEKVPKEYQFQSNEKVLAFEKVALQASETLGFEMISMYNSTLGHEDETVDGTHFFREVNEIKLQILTNSICPKS